MRVIGGMAKGRRLVCPPGDDVRPVPDLARGAIFNVLRDRLDGVCVLDLFAGAGTMGIEALSRGAALCVFVERSAGAIAALERNLAHTGLSSRAHVVRRDALRCAPALKQRGWRFDLVFVCPPFGMFLDPPRKAGLIRLLAAFAGLELLSAGAEVILQHEERSGMPQGIAGLVSRERRRYGRNLFSFYVAGDADDM